MRECVDERMCGENEKKREEDDVVWRYGVMSGRNEEM